MELGHWGRWDGEGQEDCLLFLYSPKSCLTSSCSQLFPLSFFYTISCECAVEIHIYMLWKSITVHCISTNATPCLHYKFMGYNSTCPGRIRQWSAVTKRLRFKHKMRKTRWISTRKKNRAATMRKRVVDSKGEEMPPKPLATIRLLECEVLKQPVLCVVLSLPSFSLKGLSILFIQMNIYIERKLIILYRKKRTWASTV